MRPCTLLLHIHRPDTASQAALPSSVPSVTHTQSVQPLGLEALSEKNPVLQLEQVEPSTLLLQLH